jgi:hypothetical protein
MPGLVGGDGVSLTVLFRLAWKHGSPDLCLLSSWDYSRELHAVLAQWEIQRIGEFMF